MSFEKITFKDSKELACYLMDGNELYATSSGGVAYYDNGFYMDFGGKVEPMLNALNELTWYKKTEPKWFEDIPEGGVLCWVWDDDKSNSGVSLIINFYANMPNPFETNSDGFKHAEPLTRSEILKLADNAPDSVKAKPTHELIMVDEIESGGCDGCAFRDIGFDLFCTTEFQNATFDERCNDDGKIFKIVPMEAKK